MRAERTNIGKRVQSYREARGYTLSELARLSGVSRSYLYQVESGESSPTEEKLKALADALEVSIGDLLGIDEDTTQIPESLRQFAEQERLTPAHLRRLALISYRGKQPDTIPKCHLLYLPIKLTTYPTHSSS